MKRICVFCGSSLGNDKTYRESADSLGRLLARNEIELVYGGANVGLMGVVANACLAEGGAVIGVMPEHLVDMEVAHDNLTQLHIVDTMHERKAMMNNLSDGFISLPGGIGTLEETFEMFTWLQLGLQLKPIGLLNISGFFNHLKHFLDLMVTKGYLLEQHLDMLQIHSDASELLDQILMNPPEKITKWFDKEKNRA